MGLKEFFKKRKERKEKEKIDMLKWRKFTDMFLDGNLETPYYELAFYDEEVSETGHMSLFEEYEGDLPLFAEVLTNSLPNVLKENFRKAYVLYVSGNYDEDAFDEFDGFYFEHSEELQDILDKYADTLSV